MIPRVRSVLLALALVVAAGCGNHDSSADTDKTSADLRKAQAEVAQHSRDLANNQDEIEQTKHAVVREQQELADKQKLVDQQVQQLGSAQGTLAQARAAYADAVAQRLSKVDASLATFSTKTDARSTDALAGLRARRDQLAAKLDAMPKTPDADWSTYTKDVDVTFAAIESDLRKAS